MGKKFRFGDKGYDESEEKTGTRDEKLIWKTTDHHKKRRCLKYASKDTKKGMYAIFQIPLLGGLKAVGDGAALIANAVNDLVMKQSAKGKGCI